MALKITLGCDPELFVTTKEGVFRSAHGLIPGTKANPFVVDKGAVQVDGMALEFNIDAVDNEDDWVNNINTVMAQMRAMVPGYEFAIVPSCRFNGNHFRAQPDEAKELGCEPDYNAYTLVANPRPDNQTTMRTASGHVHIGFCEGADPLSDDHMVRCATLVKQLDAYLGLPSILFDKDTKRRSMYGAAGAFRPKSYGLEYRVLSNAWLLNEKRMRFVFNQTQKAVKDLMSGKRIADQIGEENLQTVINQSDTYQASHYIRYTMPNGPSLYNEAAAL
jgi:hypothetical protein